MKKFIVSLSLLSVFYSAYSQPQNNTWMIPTNDAASSSYYKFGAGTELLPTTDPLTGLPYADVDWEDGGYIPDEVQHLGAANAISGSEGDLLFFVIGAYVFDKDGRTIYSNLNDLNKASFGFSEIMVVPDPGNCERYYLFTEAYDSPFSYAGSDISTQPMYAVLDISENQSNPNFNENALGNMVVPFTPLLAGTGLINPIAPKEPEIYWGASKIDSNGDRVILCLTAIEDDGVDVSFALVKFKLKPTGLVYIGYEDTESDLGIADRPFKARAELELVTLSSGDHRVAFTSNNELIVFDLDENTLDILPGSLQKKLISDLPNEVYAYPAGVEFTPNGDYIYVTHVPNLLRPNVIDCYDVAADAWVNLPAWANSLNAEHQNSFIEIGANGDMYMATATYLAKISNTSAPLSSTFNATFKSITYISNYWNPMEYTPYYKRYTLPDQIDGMDYTEHFTAAPECCITGQDYDVDMFTASLEWTGGANQIWTPSSNPLNGGTRSAAYIQGELRIPANINVTISGMQIYFHPDARAVVERSNVETLPNGARLSLKDGSVLTVDDRCGDHFMWQGVEVQGWKNQSQYPLFNSRQGFLQMLADSRIEHALIGAKAQGASNSNNKGGIIQATGAIFYNNRIDVQLYDYENIHPTLPLYVDNLSYFKNTQFITDGLLNIPAFYPVYHAEIRRANGIKFLGNTFENLTPSLYTENRLGYGIFNLHSKLTVVPVCTGLYLPCPPTSFTPNTFKSLNYGIYCATSTSMQAIKIDQNEFVDNMHGIFISNFDFPIITRNNFQIATSINPDFELGKTYGIYLAGSSGFKVEENDLREFDDASAITGQTRGIIVANSGIGELVLGDVPSENYYHNEIYKNTFTDLLVGGQSQSVNSPDHGFLPTSITGGLQWLCNDFNSEINADLYVPTGRIDKDQGHYLDPLGVYGTFAPYSGARNLFSQGDDTLHIRALPLVQTSNYVYYNNSETNPKDYSAPTYTKQVITMTINYTTSCPTKIVSDVISGLTYVAGLRTQIGELDSQLAAKRDTIDGGNTAGLLYLIAHQSDISIRTGLINASPYLSDTVLITYLNSSPPNGYLEEVLIVNSPLSSTVWSIFDTLSLPAPLKANVLAAQTGVSARQELMNSMNYLAANRTFWFDESIRYYLNDTTSTSGLDSIISLLQGETSLVRKQQLCDAYIAKGDTSSAANLRMQLIAAHGPTTYSDMAQININYRFVDSAMEAIYADSLATLTLGNIVADMDVERDAMRAQALLFEYVYADTVIHWVEPLLINGQNRMSEGNSQVDQTSEKGEPSVLIYPNPAANQLNITLEGISELSMIEIDFINIIGQTLITIPLANEQVGVKIDVSNIPAGIYLVSVRSVEGVFSTTRVVVE